MFRVCHIISGDLWAGAEVMAYNLLSGLKSYGGLSLSAVLLNEGRLSEEIRKLGIKVHVVDESTKTFFKILLTVRKFLGKQTPNLVHSHRYKENILAYLVSRSFNGIKLIGTQHGMPELHGRSFNLKNRLATRSNFILLSRFFHRVVPVSRDIQRSLVNHCGFREEKVTMIHNGTKIPDFALSRVKKENFVIGSSGRLFPVKDYPLMVEIAKEVQKVPNRLIFKLAGDGPDHQMLQSLVDQYGLHGNFVLNGHIENISSFYEGLDLYLNTSFHEGIPMSVIEAMAHGLPVIAPKVGGLLEIIEDGVEGYLLEDRKPRAFADKCLLLWKNNDLRETMSRAAREKALQKFSKEQMAKQYYQLYIDILNDVPTPLITPHE